MLGFEDLTQEQLESLASKSPEIAAILAEQKAEEQRMLDSIVTVEKFNARVQELNNKVSAVLKSGLRGEKLKKRLMEVYSGKTL